MAKLQQKSVFALDAHSSLSKRVWQAGLKALISSAQEQNRLELCEMNAIVIEHVKVSELPEAWREKLPANDDAHVTVRIEQEAAVPAEKREETFVTDDPAFGIWRDREDMVDVEAYVRKLRAPRYTRD